MSTNQDFVFNTMIQKELEEIDEKTKIGRDSWTTLKERGAMSDNV